MKFPWKPTEYTKRQVGLIKALARGEASPEQQKEALRFIVVDICKTYDLSFRPESERDTVFAEGKRYVGLQIVKFTQLDVTKLRFEDDGRHGSGTE